MTQRRRHIDLEIEAKIERLAIMGRSPAQIHEHLENDPQYHGRVPHLRTVQRKVGDIRSRDKSRPWTLEEATPEEGAAALPTLAAVNHKTKGGVRSISSAQASYIVKIRTAYPVGIDLFMVFLIASLYVIRTAEQEPVDDLDAYLGYQPWRSKDHHGWYYQAVGSGWVRPIPSGFSVDDDGNVTTISAKEWFRDIARQPGVVYVDTEGSDGE